MDAEFMNDNKAHKLILGGTFKHHANTAFHTVRYDFKPASVDQNQEGELEVGEANEITVTLPNVQQSKTACTVYKGSKKPIQKECVLIYDKVTGEFTLEKIASQIQVKKTRLAGNANFAAVPAPTTAPPKFNKMIGQKKQATKFPGTSKPFAKKQDNTNATQSSSAVQKKIPNPVKPPNHYEEQKDSLPTLKESELDLTPSNTNRSTFSTDDESHSSSSEGSSSSDDESSSSNEEKFSSIVTPLPVANPLPSDSQLQEDLELSESGSDSD